MAVKKRGLGKGLGALLTAAAPADYQAETGLQVRTEAALLDLPVETLAPGRYQPRKTIHDEELQSLADSIRAQGILQPIVVRPLSETQYEIIAGERRWRAAKLAGLHTVPALIKAVHDEAALAMALIENIQRENLSALEEAYALERLAKEFNLTHAEVGESVGRSRAGISNLLRLLSLNEDVQKLLEQGGLEVGHAKVLLALKGSEQSEVAKKAASEGWSVRELEEWLADDAPEYAASASASKLPMDPDVRRLLTSLSDKLGAKLRIVHRANGKGRLVIQYNSLEELDGIISHIH